MIDKAWVTEYNLAFNIPVKTSRNVLSEKTSFYLHLQDENGFYSVGECAPIFGLSIESEAELRIKISEVIYRLNHKVSVEEIDLKGFPSLAFALDMACKSLQIKEEMRIFDSDFSDGISSIKTNGLIWMGSIENMMMQLNQKVNDGFKCIKVKIGALDFKKECALLASIRKNHGSDLEIRLDANGAFSSEEAFEKLERLSAFNVHSIEQPIKEGQIEKMAYLCSNSPIPIALDEELIGVDTREASQLLTAIKPHYIILKPSLLGTTETCDSWIKEAEKSGVQWWATSALESNVGLNAIAQWVSTYKPKMYQGLGTGMIYSNNIVSPLRLVGEELMLDKQKKWDLSVIQ
jgi:o-succinylbenzoate synthase